MTLALLVKECAIAQALAERLDRATRECDEWNAEHVAGEYVSFCDFRGIERLVKIAGPAHVVVDPKGQATAMVPLVGTLGDQPASRVRWRP